MDFMDERKRAAKEARRQAKNEYSGGYVDTGAWRQWRQLKGGVTILPNDNDNKTDDSTIQHIERMYRSALEKREKKAVEFSKREKIEFENQIKLVIKQIEAQKAREARHRRKIKPKPENKFGVLLSGVLGGNDTGVVMMEEEIETPTVAPTKKGEDFGGKMDSIVTVKIERGESVQVLSKNINSTRSERGPQVLILSSTEQLVGTTFTLNSYNSSFNPEFTWQISSSLSLSPSTYGHTSLYSPSFSSPSLSHSIDFGDAAFTPPSRSYSFTDDSLSSSSSSCYSSFSFDDSRPSHSFGVPFSDGLQPSSNGNQYSFSYDTMSPQFGFEQPSEARENGKVFEKKKTLEEQLRELLERKDEINKIRSVYAQGFTTESDFKNRMAELSFGTWTEESDEFEQLLDADIDRLTTEISEKRNGPNRQPKEQKGKESPPVARGGRVERGGRGGRGGAQPRGVNANAGPHIWGSVRGRGGVNRGRGGMDRGRGGMDRGRGRGGMAVDRGARRPRPPRMPMASKHRSFMGSDTYSDISAADFDDNMSVASELTEDGGGGFGNGHFPYVPTSAFTMQGYRLRDQLTNCLKVLVFLVKYATKEDIQKNSFLKKLKDNMYNVSGLMENIEHEVFLQREADIKEREKQKNPVEERPAYDDYNSGEYIEEQYNIQQENNEEEEKEKEDDDNDDGGYMSSNMFLTDDDEGYYYEKQSEDRKSRKQKSRQRNLILVPVTIFSAAAELEMFPARTLPEVPSSTTQFINRYDTLKAQYLKLKRDEWLAEQASQDKMEERMKKKEQKEASKNPGPQSFYAIPEEKDDNAESDKEDEDEDSDDEPAIDRSVLDSMLPDEQKNLLGEKLYSKIHKQQPDLAGKITGMFLESIEIDELLQILEDKNTLQGKIDEAVDTLKESQQEEEAEGEYNDDDGYGAAVFENEDDNTYTGNDESTNEPAGDDDDFGGLFE